MLLPRLETGDALRNAEQKIVRIEFKVFFWLFVLAAMAVVITYLVLRFATQSPRLNELHQFVGLSFKLVAIIGTVGYWFAALVIVGLTRTVFMFFRDPVSAVLSPPEQKMVEFMLKERQSISDLAQRDLSFSKLQFLDMAEIAFFKVHEALVNRDIDIVSAFISPDIYQRLYDRIEKLLRSKQLFLIENLKVNKAEIYHYCHTDDNGGTDHVIAKIEASAVFQISDEQDRMNTRGARAPRKFTEYYLFARSDRTNTPYRKTEYVSRHCQNCGAPLDLEKLGECGFCGSKSPESALVSEGSSQGWSLLRPGDERKSRSIFKEYCPNCGAELPSGNIKKCAHCGSMMVSGKFTWILENIMDRCFIIPEQPFRPTFDYDFFPKNAS